MQNLLFHPQLSLLTILAAQLARNIKRRCKKFNYGAAAISMVYALIFSGPLGADEIPKNPLGDTSDPPAGAAPISGSWLYDWAVDDLMGELTAWKQARMSRNRQRIKLEWVKFENMIFRNLEAISETSFNYEVVDEWQGEDQGVLLLKERLF